MGSLAVDIRTARSQAADTLVADLTPLSAITTLGFIDVSRTHVTSFEALAGSELGALNATDIGLTSLESVHDVPRLRRLVVDGNAISDVSPLTRLQPIWVDLRRNPLDAAAAAIIQDLCGKGWAIDWDGGSCGDSCRFESCTD